jgi:hypothetical protein
LCLEVSFFNSREFRNLRMLERLRAQIRKLGGINREGTYRASLPACGK